MKTLNVIGVIVAESIIALVVGIAIVTAAASLLLVQSVGATTDLLATTTAVGRGGQEAASSTTTTTNNNVSNAVLGSLFLTGEDKLTSFNPINKTYTKVSYVGNRTIMPLNGNRANCKDHNFFAEENLTRIMSELSYA